MQDAITGAPVTAAGRFIEVMVYTAGLVGGVGIALRLTATLGASLPPSIVAEPVLNRMNTEPVTQVLRANRQLAEIMAIQGTPTFIIGDEMLRGLPRAGLAATIQAIRQDS